MMTGKTTFNVNPKKALAATGISFVILIFLGLFGLFYLQGMEYVTSIILALSAGGIFFMLHYVMISKIQKDGKWLPTFGSVFGFGTGFAMITTTWWVPITQT